MLGGCQTLIYVSEGCDFLRGYWGLLNGGFLLEKLNLKLWTRHIVVRSGRWCRMFH